MNDTYNEALVELEKIGWPCRLVELPAKYDKVARELAAMTAERDNLQITINAICQGITNRI